MCVCVCACVSVRVCVCVCMPVLAVRSHVRATVARAVLVAHDNSDTMAALTTVGIDAGFSFHSYPGNMKSWWNKSELASFLLNATWLRSVTLAQVAPCLAAWNAGPRAAGLAAAVTEAAAMCGGHFAPGAPTTASFIHGFFSIAQLGQFARAGVTMVARWGVPDLLGLRSSGARWVPTDVAADLFLYSIYNATVGHGVLSVAGDDASEALVYAHCSAEHAFGANGSVTLLAANPSSSAVWLSVSLATRPRLEYVLTAPKGDLASKNPVLNGKVDAPLALGSDGSLPAMRGAFCGSGEPGCEPTLKLPPRSQGFFVLLGAQSRSCTAMVEESQA